MSDSTKIEEKARAGLSANLSTIEKVLAVCVERGASDVHIKSNHEPLLRIEGELLSAFHGIISQDELLSFIKDTLPPFAQEKWEREAQADYSYNLAGGESGRFRVNCFYQRGMPGLVFRHVKDNPPTFEELRHDSNLFKRLCGIKNGIILICGPTGSGKSSTLAAMVDYINRTQTRHIITLEDPIEYSYSDVKSIVNQREIGIDMVDFRSGLKAAMRQDPDIILVGELRDAESFEAALQAADTGHLVLSTVHATGAQQVIQRIMEYFPKGESDLRAVQLAGALRAAISQRLVINKEGDSRVPVTEVMIVESLARKAIEQGEFQKLSGIIEACGDIGSKTFNQDLKRLVDENAIAREIALEFSPNRKALEMLLKGIKISTGGILG